jgi:galactokinase
VEFIGNHTDYNGGWVLGSTIDSRIEVGVARRADPTIRMKSSADVPPVQVPHDEVVPQNGDRAWANYVLGVFSVLRDEGVPLQTGVDLSVHSTLPTGAGLSSSAALEVATALALTEMVGEPLDRRTIARVARRAENEFVGVPCGILDQAVVAFGGEDQLVRIDARTNEIGVVPFPSETRLWIFRTHRSHSLADAHYQERYDEAHAARDRLSNRFDDVEHLVDVSPDQLKASRDVLPDPLFRRARHVMTEHRRVQTVVRLLREGDLEGAGKLLVESHESSRTDYENSTPELDFLVHRLAKESEVLGARLTGAGFGGAAMAWTREDFSRDDARAVEAAYDERFGEGVDVMACQPAPGGGVQSPV